VVAVEAIVPQSSWLALGAGGVLPVTLLLCLLMGSGVEALVADVPGDVR